MQRYECYLETINAVSKPVEHSELRLRPPSLHLHVSPSSRSCLVAGKLKDSVGGHGALERAFTGERTRVGLGIDDSEAVKDFLGPYSRKALDQLETFEIGIA